jgi:hypothetical protein
MTRRFGGKKDEEETRDLGAEGALIKREEGGALVKRSEQSQVAGKFIRLSIRKAHTDIAFLI